MRLRTPPFRWTLVGALLVLSPLSGACQDVPPPEPAVPAVPAASGAVVEAFLQAYNAHSVEEMLRLVTDDIAWYSVADSTIAIETAGKEALRVAMAAHFAARPWAKSELLSLHAVDRFVTTVEVAVRLPPDTRRSQASVAVYELEGDRIRNVWYFAAVPAPL